MSQGKHRKTVLEVPTGVLVKREGSLGEACALSAPLFMADPTPHTCTQALCSQLPSGAPCPSLSPGLEEEHPLAQPKSDDMGSPGCPMGPAGLQGLRETTLWEPSRQAGEAMEDVLPETLGDRFMGKEVRHPEPN